jgi:NOL1/NOP2/fmu family ribosome biogenesis protein
MTANDGDRFDRVPATDAEREVEDRPTRQEILDWWQERFGIEPDSFANHTFWERGTGKLWVFHGDVTTPIEIEGLGMTCLRTRGEHWKPTTSAVQRFGHHASKNVLPLSDEQAQTFVAGEDQELDWDGDWGYLIVAHEIAGETAPIGVGLYVHGELRSQIPKGRRRDL